MVLRVVAATWMFALLAAGCTNGRDGTIHLVVSASAVGAEGELLRAQLDRFMNAHPGVVVEARPAPDAADQRHQLYVQWLNARAPEPDVLQLDVIWIAEMAAAGWLLPLDDAMAGADDFFPGTVSAGRYAGTQYAVPWFVDVGMLYWRSDLLDHPPATMDELVEQAGRVRSSVVKDGLVWQGARYEGLVTVFLEHLGAFGGRILDNDGAVAIDSLPARRALAFMRDCVDRTGIVPEEALGWQEEHARFAFQNGEAVFMRNWPYAWPLMQDKERSKVAGRFAVAPMPGAPGGSSTAALGGSQLAVNLSSHHPDVAIALVRFLTEPAQMLERARVAGQYPPRRSLYESEELAASVAIPPVRMKEIIARAVPRPVTPVYTQLSEVLQIHLHEALTGKVSPDEALRAAAEEMQSVLDDAAPPPGTKPASVRPPVRAPWIVLPAIALLLLFAAWRSSRGPYTREREEARFAWLMMAPALLVIALVAVFPLAFTAWESLHRHDLRMPWQGMRFVGLHNYAALFGNERFVLAFAHTLAFTIVSVAMELPIGLALAMVLNARFRGRGPMRALLLLPWAVPTVVAALVWRFMFDSRAGIVDALLVRAGVMDEPLVWTLDALLAWVPIVLADVWKTVPFVALLLLAALQGIDESLYESACIDGATLPQRFFRITLPMLVPTMLTVTLFRALDAFKVFDLVYVMTGGGPGTATEPLSLYAFNTLMQNLRFGFGSAVSIVVFIASFTLALGWLALQRRESRA